MNIINQIADKKAITNLTEGTHNQIRKTIEIDDKELGEAVMKFIFQSKNRDGIVTQKKLGDYPKRVQRKSYITKRLGKSYIVYTQNNESYDNKLRCYIVPKRQQEKDEYIDIVLTQDQEYIKRAGEKNDSSNTYGKAHKIEINIVDASTNKDESGGIIQEYLYDLEDKEILDLTSNEEGFYQVMNKTQKRLLTTFLKEGSHEKLMLINA